MRGPRLGRKWRLGKKTQFRVADDGSLMMGQWLYVPDDETVKHMVLWEAHESKFSIHLDNFKMYQDLKHLYWWPNMKREIAEYVSKYEVCQQLKVEHQIPAKPLQIPEWKWGMIIMDFVLGFPKWRKGDDAIWVIVDRLMKSAIFLPIKMIDLVESLPMFK